MKAIIFADRIGLELQPLTEKICVAMLPIGLKPLIEHTVEALLTTQLASQIEDVIIVISQDADKIKRHLGNGEKWGMRFTYVLSCGQELPEDVLSRLGQQLNDNMYFILRGDMLRSMDMRAFYKQSIAYPANNIYVTIEGQPAGVALIRKQSGHAPWRNSNLLCCEMLTNYTKESTIAKPIAVIGQSSLIASLKTYHQVNLSVAKGSYSSLVIPGRLVNEHLQTGRRSPTNTASTGLIGDYCHGCINAKMIKNVVIGDRVIIEEGASIQHCVVLSDTYIGKQVELNHAIVAGDLLIRVDLDVNMHITDHFLMADLHTESLPHLLENYLHRLLGIVLLTLSLPLWGIAAILALFNKPYAPLHHNKLCGNLKIIDDDGNVQCKEFLALEWNVSVPILRHLPKILSVIKGDLRLIGVEAKTLHELRCRQADWEFVRDQAPVGLLGPTCDMPDNIPYEERTLAEAFYAKTRHIGIDLFWLLRSVGLLFHYRSWLPKKK